MSGISKAAKAELDTIKAKAPRGVLLPKMVIKEAQKKDSALHKYFTWDKESGWQKNLMVEAQEVISQYTIKVITQNGQEREVRKYVSLSIDRVAGGGYRALTDVVSNADLRKVLLEDALRELETFQAKYQKLKELKPVFFAAESVRNKPIGNRRDANRRGEKGNRRSKVRQSRQASRSEARMV